MPKLDQGILHQRGGILEIKTCIFPFVSGWGMPVTSRRGKGEIGGEAKHRQVSPNHSVALV